MVAGITDFIALDVETANADFASICAIGLVHFRASTVFKSLTILIDPEDEFADANVRIHGICSRDVIGKPTMAKVFPIISAALQDSAIIHHSPFDRTALAQAAVKYGTGGLPCVWLDSCQVAKQTWESFREDGGYGLANLARRLGYYFDITTPPKTPELRDCYCSAPFTTAARACRTSLTNLVTNRRWIAVHDACAPLSTPERLRSRIVRWATCRRDDRIYRLTSDIARHGCKRGVRGPGATLPMALTRKLRSW